MRRGNLGLRRCGLAIVLVLLAILYYPYGFGQGDSGQSYRIDIYIDGYDGVSPVIVNVFDENLSLIFNETFSSDFIEFMLNESGDYYVAVIYKKVPYVRQVSISSGLATINFTVYDVINDDSTINVPVHHIILYPEGSSIKVMGVFFVRNNGDHVVINGTRIRVYLPKDYIKLSSDVMSCCIEQVEEGFIFNLMTNLLPNQVYRVTYSYELPVTSQDYYFEIPTSYYTEYIMVAVKEGYEIGNPLNLVYKGQIDVEEGKFRIYEGYNLSAGAKVGLLIKGVGGGNVWVLSALVVGTSGFIIALTLWSAFKRKPSLEELERQKEELLAVMEDIENRFKGGELDEEEYLRLRIRYKKKIIRLMKRIDKMKKQRGIETEESGGDK